MDKSEPLPGRSRGTWESRSGGIASSSLPSYSSTPAVMPSNFAGNAGEEIDIKLQKANMKLPLKSVVNQPSGVLASNGEGVSHQHVTLRNQHNYSASTLISPIVPSTESRNYCKLTEPPPREGKGNRREEYSYVSSRNNTVASDSSASKSIFPYPEPRFPEETEPGEILCQMLKVLNFHVNIETEQHRLSGTKKKKDKLEEKVAPYEFENDTFVNVNSDAANHALYLIFGAIDAAETELRFRDCWPVYEKKLEGVFRRAASRWIKVLIEENPMFFPELVAEAIGGLLVNPGGERFISFLRQLCRLAIFTVADGMKDLIQEQLLLPPVANADPEITNRQMHVLEFRTRRGVDALRERHKMLLNREIQLEHTMEMVDRHEKKISRCYNTVCAKVADYLNKYPELFGNPTEDEIRKREAALSHLDLRAIIDRGDGWDFDPFVKKLESALHRRIDEIYKPVSLVHDVLEDFSDLWYIIEMDTSEPVELDWESISASLAKEGSEDVSLNSFLKNFIATTETLLSHEYFNRKTPTDLLRDYEEASRRIKLVEIMHREIVKNTRPRPSMQRRKKRSNRMNVLRQCSINFDWSRLSKVTDSGINDLFDITPLLVYDVNRSSGKTPWINNFLESSPSSSSGELQSTSVIVGRRNVQIRKNKKAVRYNKASKACTDKQHRPVDTVDFGESSTDNLSSNRIESTPLSSTHSQSIGIRGSSLFRDFSMSNSTPVEVVRPMPSFRMKKSVSFDQSSDFTPSLVDSLSVSVRKRKSRISPEPLSFDDDTNITNTSESPLVANGKDLSYGHSFNSSSSTPVVDSLTQERLNKLLAVASSSYGRASISPIIRPEPDVIDPNNESVTRTSDTPLIPKSADNGANLEEFSDGTPELCGIEQVPHFSFNGTDTSSILEDFEGVKGIMETSYSVMDFLRHSDSDD